MVTPVPPLPVTTPLVIPSEDGPVLDARTASSHEVGWHCGLFSAGLATVVLGWRPGSLMHQGIPDVIFTVFGLFLVVGPAMVLLGALYRRIHGGLGGLACEAAGLAVTMSAEIVYAGALIAKGPQTGYVAYFAIVGLIVIGSGGRLLAIGLDMLASRALFYAQQRKASE